jgi:hypothetical protein
MMHRFKSAARVAPAALVAPVALVARVTFVAMLVLAASHFVDSAFAQPGSSDFDPRSELARITSMQKSYRKVRQLYYLGDLTSRSKNDVIAREAYRQALLTYRELTGNHQSIALPYAAQAVLGLAGLRHLEFRDSVIRLDDYAADSTARYDLLKEARNEYNIVAQLNYPRSSFEALFLRAHMLEEWDHGEFDELAETQPEIEALETVVRHVNLTGQLSDRAVEEFRTIVKLEDSLDLADGVGDLDVSRWTDLARVNIEDVDSRRDTLRAREEALQALYAERNAAQWLERAVPLLWSRIDSIAAERNAGLADPFVDYWLQDQLVNKAYRPFLFGDDGFYTRQEQATEGARAVRGADWINDRIRWRRRLEWTDAEVSRKLAREGLKQLARVPRELDTAMQLLAAKVDSLPADWRKALEGAPPAPDVSMPAIPNFGGVDPRMLAGEEEAQIISEYDRFATDMAKHAKVIRAFRANVTDFVDLVDNVTSREMDEATRNFVAGRNGMEAAQRLLLDTLSTWVVRQVQVGLETSRASAVWLGPQSVGASDRINDYQTTTVSLLREIATTATEAARRHERAAEALDRRVPAYDHTALAQRLRKFAKRLRETAVVVQPISAGESP